MRPPRLPWRKCRDVFVGQHMTRHNQKKATVRPLSALLVCRRIMPSVERLSSKFHSSPRSFDLGKLSIFGQSFSLGHSRPIHQPPTAVYLLIIPCHRKYSQLECRKAVVYSSVFHRTFPLIIAIHGVTPNLPIVR